MFPATEWKFCSICFLSFICENTRKVWQRLNWHGNQNLMIFDLLTSPQGHQFDPRMKILLTFCSARYPCRFDMPHDHVWKKKKKLTSLGTPSAPKSHPWDMSKVTEWKSLLICFVSFICKLHTKFGIKIFEIDMLTEILWYMTFWPHPKVTSLTLGWKIYLHSVLLVIPVDLICHMTRFEKKKFDPLGTPRAPKSNPWGMTQATELKSCLICFVSFICENKHSIKIFKIDFVIEIKWYFELLTPPQGARGRGKKNFADARPIYVSNSHTKFGWISSNGLGDRITDRQTEAITIFPSLFLKRVGINIVSKK